MINDRTLGVVPGDKNSCVMLMKRALMWKGCDYLYCKDSSDDVTCGVRTPTTDNAPKDHETLLDFLYRNF